MSMGEQSGKRVIVVGGGLAGLSAAESLSRNRPDIHVTVLESRRTVVGEQDRSTIRSPMNLSTIASTWQWDVAPTLLT